MLILYALCVCMCVWLQVVVDPTPTAPSDGELKVGSRVWLKEKDLYGFVRYCVEDTFVEDVCMCLCSESTYL